MVVFYSVLNFMGGCGVGSCETDWFFSYRGKFASRFTILVCEIHIL